MNITDAWGRTLTDTWGTSDAGLPWETATLGWDVAAGTATMSREFSGDPTNGLEFAALAAVEARFWFDYAAVGDAIWVINLDALGFSSNNYVSFDLFTDEGHVYLNRDGGAGNDAAGLFSGKTEVRLRCDAVGTYAKLWPYGTPEPAGWSLVDEPVSPASFAGDGFSFSMDAIATGNVTITVGPLDITDVNACLFTPLTTTTHKRIVNSDGSFVTTTRGTDDYGPLAEWQTHASASPLDQEGREYLTINLPTGTRRVRIYGGVYGQNFGIPGVGYENASAEITHVSFATPSAPDWDPAFLGPIASPYGLVNLNGDPGLLSSFDVTIEVAPGATTFQLMIKNTSAEGQSAAGVGPRGGGGATDPIISPTVFMWANTAFFPDPIRFEGTLGGWDCDQSVLGPCRCPPYAGSSIIDAFDTRGPINQWGTPTRGIPDWVRTTGASSGGGVSTADALVDGFGKSLLTLSGTPSGGVTPNSIGQHFELPLPEVINIDDFEITLHLVAAAPSAPGQGQAGIVISYGTFGTAHVIDVLMQFNKYAASPGDAFIQVRDLLDGNTHAFGPVTVGISSFDSTITINRSVARGTTIFTLGAVATYETTNGPSSLDPATQKLRFDHGAFHDPGVVHTVESSLDNIILKGSRGARPLKYQRVQDEYIGIGDGSSTSYATRWPYVAHTLQVQVGGMLADVDNSGPALGEFELVDPAPAGAQVIATYTARGA